MLDSSALAHGRTALVVGASGIAGSALVALLAESGWDVLGLSRGGVERPGARPVSADLSSPESLAAALAGESPTHVFFTAWSRQDTERENIEVNAALLRNLLDALRDRPVKHVALMTGLKHYLGPFEAYAAGEMPDTPFHEERAAAAGCQLLLRPGGRVVRRGGAPGVQLVGAPRAHRDRPRGRATP